MFLYFYTEGDVEVYTDGQLQVINSQDKSAVKFVKIPRNTHVLGLKVTNLGTNRGLLASVSSRSGVKSVSDGSWKVSTTIQSNWSDKSFNDSLWQQARPKALHGAAPWNVHLSSISLNAWHIWEPTNLSTVVCFRVYLGL